MQRDPHVRVLILTVYADEDMSRAAQSAGAHGFLCKCDLAENLSKAIEALTRGRNFLSAAKRSVIGSKALRQTPPTLFDAVRIGAAIPA